LILLAVFAGAVTGATGGDSNRLLPDRIPADARRDGFDLAEFGVALQPDARF